MLLIVSLPWFARALAILMRPDGGCLQRRDRKGLTIFSQENEPNFLSRISRPATLAIMLMLLVSLGCFAQKDPKDNTPRECYLSYLNALCHAKDIKDISLFFTRARYLQLRKAPPEEQAKQLKQFKAYYISSPKFLEEKIDGSKAHLKLTGTGMSGDKPFSASSEVNLVREDNYWRVDSATLTGTVNLD
jgi:hypothetical protein